MRQPVHRLPSARRGVGGVPGGTETILLVEDDEAVRAMVREALQVKGYTVLEAADAEAALSAAGRHGKPVSLLLADIGLPGPSGPELARRLAERTPGLRVIFLTGYTDEHLGAEAAVPGRLLRKPFGPDALARLVREVLDGAPPAKP
jgi:CheY-like chemotaxis protein